MDNVKKFYPDTEPKNKNHRILADLNPEHKQYYFLELGLLHFLDVKRKSQQ